MWVEFNINMFTCTISLPNYIVDYKDLFILHTYSLAKSLDDNYQVIAHNAVFISWG